MHVVARAGHGPSPHGWSRQAAAVVLRLYCQGALLVNEEDHGQGCAAHGALLVAAAQGGGKRSRGGQGWDVEQVRAVSAPASGTGYGGQGLLLTTRQQALSRETRRPPCPRKSRAGSRSTQSGKQHLLSMHSLAQSLHMFLWPHGIQTAGAEGQGSKKADDTYAECLLAPTNKQC
jgi:hypothetical protein